jgi:hypothetical protein
MIRSTAAASAFPSSAMLRSFCSETFLDDFGAGALDRRR